jgi:hypothetical protein
LRLANALDIRSGDRRTIGKKIGKKSESDGVPRIEVSAQDRFVEVRVGGYSALERSAENVAAARHLLETVLRRPLLVRTLRPPSGGSRSAGPMLVTKRRAPGASREASRN